MLISIIVSYGYHLNGPKQISLLTKLNHEADLIKDLVSLRLVIAAILSILILALTFSTNLFNNYDNNLLEL